MSESWKKVAERGVDTAIYLGFPAVIWWGYPCPEFLAWCGLILACISGLLFVLAIVLKIAERRP